MLSTKVQNRIFDVLLGILLGFSLVYTLESSLNLRFSLANLFFISFALFMLYIVIFLNRLTALITLSVLGAGVIASVSYLTFTQSWKSVYTFVDNYMYWLTDYMEYFNQPNALFTLLTVICLSIIVSLVVYIFGVKHFIFPILLIAGAALFSVQWMYEFITDFKPFYIFTFLIILYYLRYVFTKKQAAGKNDYVSHAILLLCMIPVCGVIILTASLIQVSNKPLEWKWLDGKVAKISDYFDQRFDYKTFDYFSVASSGFSQNDSSLGGRVRLNNTPVLTVKTPKRVYLRGSVKDIYTGSSWEESNPGMLTPVDYTVNSLYSTKNMISFLLLSINMTDPNVEKLPDFCTKDTITVKFERLKTKTIFTPLNYHVIYKDTATKNVMKGLLSSENGAISGEYRQEKGFSYSLLSYNFNYSDENLISTLKKCTGGLYKSSQVELNSKSASVETNIIYNIPYDNNLLKTIEAIRTKYLQLPDKLPQRVRDLSLSITTKYNNDYDKAKAIEKYLSGNFPYTLDTKSLPRNRDFVDYFLFDQKKGYCTYFASAMTVMARSSGIPARYVEGYMLPPSPNKEGDYTVTNMNAHAWVEIYLEGFGWVPFEPTAPFVATFYSNNTAASSTEGSYPGINAFDQYQKMMDRFSEDSNLDPDVDFSNTKASEKIDNKILTIRIVAAVILLLILFFLSLNLVNILKHRFKLANISGLAPKESVISAYEYYLEVLRLQKLGIAPGETPFTYSKRIDFNLSFFKTNFNTISRIFTKARYSTLDITEGDKILVFDFHLDLLSETRSNTGKFKFFILKNILGRI